MLDGLDKFVEEYCKRASLITNEFEQELVNALLDAIVDYYDDPTDEKKSHIVHYLRRHTEKSSNELENELRELWDDAIQSTSPDISKYGKRKSRDQAIKDADKAMEKYWKFVKSKGRYTSNIMVGNTMKTVEQFFVSFIEKYSKAIIQRERPIRNLIADAIDDLTSRGVSYIDYESGVHRSIEASIRQQLLYNLKTSAQERRFLIARDSGATIFEFTAHADARPSHQTWQGKRFDITGEYYPTLDELTHGEHNDYGCRHDYYPIYHKDDKPAHTDEQLKNINTKPFKFKGKEYTGYEARQRMRDYERRIRKYKKRDVYYKEMKVDDDVIKKNKYKLSALRSEYADFCKAYGEPQRIDRLKIGKK